ncbi:ricin-type beta-trefoil lectin domain protein [Streptomyces sp. NPDC007856]|uniref:ricin-type beta-trefoil lectin domain protein n=1 Tax=Streptomyces sp. NPDC007856 TaxID=3364781 RepID=UPI0036BF015A
MDYCGLCRRSLNGAFSCPGCGTLYKGTSAADRTDHTADSDAGRSSATDPASDSVAEAKATASAPQVSERPAMASPRRGLRHGSPLLWTGAAGLVALCAVVGVLDAQVLGPVGARAAGAQYPGSGDQPDLAASSTDSASVPTPSRTPETATPRSSGSATSPADSASGSARPGASSRADGTPVAVGSTSPQQRSSRPAVPPGPSASFYPDTVTSSAGACLSVGEDTPHGGTSLVLAPCDGSAGQVWHWTAGGGLRSGSGDRCLDVVSGDTAAGTDVQLFTCNGTAAQVWEYSPSRQLFNPHSGRCVDSASLALWDCADKAAQQWNVHID